MQCYGKTERGRCKISNKDQEKNEEYTWINLSAKEALSYKTEISTRDSRERQPRGQFKAHYRIIDCFREVMQCSFPLQKYLFTDYREIFTFRGQKRNIACWCGEKVQIS